METSSTAALLGPLPIAAVFSPRLLRFQPRPCPIQPIDLNFPKFRRAISLGPLHQSGEKKPWTTVHGGREIPAAGWRADFIIETRTRREAANDSLIAESARPKICNH